MLSVWQQLNETIKIWLYFRAWRARIYSRVRQAISARRVLKFHGKGTKLHRRKAEFREIPVLHSFTRHKLPFSFHSCHDRRTRNNLRYHCVPSFGKGAALLRGREFPFARFVEPNMSDCEIYPVWIIYCQRGQWYLSIPLYAELTQRFLNGFICIYV